MENYIIRSKAREQLKEKTGLAIRTILLSTILLNIINVTLNISEEKFMIFSIFFIIGYLFISAPIEAGRCRFLLNMVQNKEEAKITDLFSQFSIFIKVFVMGLIKFFMESICLLIPIGVIIIKSSSIFIDVMNGFLDIGDIATILILSIISLIMVLIIQIIYSQMIYIMVENPDMTPIECMRSSRRMIKGYKLKYFKLQLSFIGWWLISGLTLGLLTIWVAPYSMLANANFYEEIKNIKYRNRDNY